MPTSLVATNVRFVALADRMKWLLDEYLKTSGRELARRAGIAQAIVNNIAQGKGAKIESLEAIVRAVPGLNGHWLLTGEGAPVFSASKRAAAAIEKGTYGLLGPLESTAISEETSTTIQRAAREVAKQRSVEVRVGRTRRSAKKVEEGATKIAAERAAEEKRRPKRRRA